MAQNGDEFYTVMTAYTTTDYSGEARVCDDESMTLAWVDMDKLPENIAKTQRKVIDDYIRRVRENAAL